MRLCLLNIYLVELLFILYVVLLGSIVFFVFTYYSCKNFHKKVSFYSRISFKEVAARINCDMVIIASATNCHINDYELVKSYDIPIIFEKPISESYEKSLNFLTTQESIENKYVFFQRRMATQIQAIQKLISSSKVGLINSVSIQISKYKYKEGPAYLSHLGIHYIDLVFFLLCIDSFSLASFFPDQSIGSERRASVAGCFNHNLPFSLLLDCQSKYSSSTYISIQCEHASIIISDLSISFRVDSRIDNLFSEHNLGFSGISEVDLPSYCNYWRHLFETTTNLPSDPLPLPTLHDALLAEKFIHECYLKTID